MVRYSSYEKGNCPRDLIFYFPTFTGNFVLIWGREATRVVFLGNKIVADDKRGSCDLQQSENREISTNIFNLILRYHICCIMAP